MAKAQSKGQASAPGQAKLHDYTRTVDGVEETGSFPQSEHQTRKAEGWARVDGVDETDEVEEGDESSEPTSGTDSGGAQGQG